MKVVVGYESMYGSTHEIADAVAAGFSGSDDVATVPVNSLDANALACDVLIIGAPTHAHGLPRPGSRHAAIDAARTRYDDHPVDPSAGSTGVREWLDTLPDNIPARVAAFDTRFRPPAWLVGHPARRIDRVLRRHGATSLAHAESFYVDKHEHLRPGEVDRARRWGEELRARAAGAAPDDVTP